MKKERLLELMGTPVKHKNNCKEAECHCCWLNENNFIAEKLCDKVMEIPSREQLLAAIDDVDLYEDSWVRNRLATAILTLNEKEER